MDNFAEQLVKKNETSSDKTRRIFMILFGVFLTVSILFLSFLQINRPITAFLGMIVAAASGFVTFFSVRSTYVEYEYTFTNGELDVDKIIAKRKRMYLISTNVRSFNDFGKYEDGMEETEDLTVIFATDNIASHEYYAEFSDESYGNVRLVFAPDVRMLENIRKFLPSKLKKQSI